MTQCQANLGTGDRCTKEAVGEKEFFLNPDFDYLFSLVKLQVCDIHIKEEGD